MKIGFNNKLYMKYQTEEIEKRISESGGQRLYLELGGKLFNDQHAARVLPGFDPNVKIKLLQKFGRKAEVIVVVSAKDLERNKIRSDSFVDYGSDALKLIDLFTKRKILVNSLVITQYEGQHVADIYKKKVERRGIKVYVHTRTKGYPTDIKTIISKEGYGQNPYIKTTKPVVVVTAPGPGSGKLATCLCQMYHEYKKGEKPVFAKFETFPVWNLPLKHPVNLAYEAATADLRDVNMIDFFHFDTYKVSAVNYNRDIEIFPVIKTILSQIMGKELYQSPTDMGINMVGKAITNNDLIVDAAKKEVLRRYFKAQCDYLQGQAEIETQEKIELLMSDLGLTETDRSVVNKAREKSKKEKGVPAVAIELHNGKVIVGKESKLLTASSAMVLNSIKTLAGIDDKINLISPSIIEPIKVMRRNILKEKTPLFLEEVLIALSICAIDDENARVALNCIDKLGGCDAHATHMLSGNDELFLHKLNVYISTEPRIYSDIDEKFN